VRLLADENFPREAVNVLRGQGHDLVWVRTDAPGATDRVVLARAQQEDRIVITFDKDFGELAFRFGLPSSCGVVLFRIRASSPEALARRCVDALGSRQDWAGHFSVVEDDRIRMTPLPQAKGE